MKILKLVAENFKKLSAVEITPDGNMVVISGKNGAGKSSVLDAIEAALCGGRVLPKQPVKKGEILGKVEVDMGEYKVTRKFFGATSTLTVETTGETKTKISSPQAFLDKIVGNLSFDPLAFLNKQPAEQRNILIDFLGLDLETFDNKIATIKTKRSEIRKKKERFLHEADSLVFTPNLPPQEISSETLLSEHQAIIKKKQKCQENFVADTLTQQELSSIVKEIEAAQAAIEDWNKKLTRLLQAKSRLESQMSQRPAFTTKSTAEVEAKLKSLDATNAAIRRNQQKKTALAAFDDCAEEYTRLGDDIKVIENQKAKKLAETVMPVKGLTILSDGLAFNGIPLEQVNTAKQLEICVAISMAMNPKLKVLRINGNDLDTESLLAIGKVVNNQDYQIWVEKVSDDDKIGFYIEDGVLAAEKDLNDFADDVEPCLRKGLPGAIREGLKGKNKLNIYDEISPKFNQNKGENDVGSCEDAENYKEDKN